MIMKQLFIMLFYIKMLYCYHQMRRICIQINLICILHLLNCSSSQCIITKRHPFTALALPCFRDKFIKEICMICTRLYLQKMPVFVFFRASCWYIRVSTCLIQVEYHFIIHNNVSLSTTRDTYLLQIHERMLLAFI